MDCEKFDRIVLDLLYDELDELTSAAARRHMESCSRCGPIAAKLRATREVGLLPLVASPEGLSTRILSAERQARSGLPLRQRFGRGISVVAAYAMRPEFAMAALLLLMVGSSLVFLRARPGEADSIRVVERGVPEREADSVAVVAEPPSREQAPAPLSSAARAETRDEDKARRSDDAPAPGAAGAALAANEAEKDKKSPSGDYDGAMDAYRAGRYAEAETRFSTIAAQAGEQSPSAALFAAQATRNSTGCSAAAERFDNVHARYAGTNVGYEAAWQAADCYRSLGQNERARKNYELLLATTGYAERAQRALAELTGAETRLADSQRAAAADGEGSAAARTKATAAPSKPAAKAAAPPAATDAPGQ